MSHEKVFTYLILLVQHTVPYEPQSPRIAMIPDSPMELHAIWEPPLEPNGVITAYKVYCSESDVYEDGSGSGYMYLTPYTENTSTNAIISTIVVSGNVTEAIVSGLTPYTLYECYVTANTSIGEGSASQTVVARTDESSK